MSSPSLVVASAGDPLAGVDRPQGDAGGLAGLAGRYEAGAAALDSTARGLVRVVGQVLGQAWTGTAAASCAASCVRSAQAVAVAGQAYGAAGSALRAHAARLGAAQADWDAARRLADQALLEEHAHRQAAAAAALQPGGSASFGDLVWNSPLRVVARARAEQAVAEVTASAAQAVGVLEGLVAPFRVQAPSPAPGESGDDSFLSGVVHSLESQAWGFVRPVFQGGADLAYGQSLQTAGSPPAPGVTFGAAGDPHSLDREDMADVVAQVRAGHVLYGLGWGAGLLLPDAGSGAAAGAAGLAARAGTIAKGLPGALQGVKVLMIETPEGVRFPSGVDASSLRTWLSEAVNPRSASGEALWTAPGSGGTLRRNALEDHEFEQAKEIAEEMGGHFEGHPQKNAPGIDGWYDGQPASLKTVQVDVKSGVRALANELTKARNSLTKAGYTDALLFVRIPKMSVREILATERARQILELGGFEKIYIRGSDGWVEFS